MLEWRAFMGRYYREGDPKDQSNLYGYLAAQIMVQILKQCGNDLTRENVMRQAANLKNLKLPLLLPGMTINTGPSDFFPVQQAQLERFTGPRPRSRRRRSAFSRACRPRATRRRTPSRRAGTPARRRLRARRMRDSSRRRKAASEC